MATLLHDLRMAMRLIAKNPSFSLIVILTLALGIGLNTAVFSAVDGLLLQPLPGVYQSDRLVQLYRSWPGLEFGSNSIPHYFDVRDRSKDVMSGVALWKFQPMNLSVDGRPERIMGQTASANFFSVLGARAALGRTFVPAEDSGQGAHPVVVLSDAGWRKYFGADPKVVGKTFILNGDSYEVVGVTEPEFKGAMSITRPAMWAPLVQIAQLERNDFRWTNRGNNSFQMFGRMAPGITVDRVRQRTAAIITELSQVYPDDYRRAGSTQGSLIAVVPQAEAGIHPMFKSAQVGLTAVIMAVVVVLLLIACVNVANLMLARARDRSREMAVRLSIGADRRVLIRQLLTESLVLSVIAGGMGLLVAWWAMGIANRATGSVPVEIDISPDLRVSGSVLVFTLGISLITGVLFGLAPALQATRPALIPALKGEAPAGGSRSRMSRGLVIAQMALSIVLLVSAGLFLRSLKAATAIDKGFTSDNLLVADLDPGLQGYSRARTDDFYRRLEERLEASPAVKSVVYSDRVPLMVGTNDWTVEIPGYTPAPNENMSIYVSTVGPGYFEAMGIGMVAGRGFQQRDDSAAARVIVVNQRFADRFWPNQDPIGKTVKLGGDHTVIGVTPTGKYATLGEDPTAQMYLAQAQHWSSGMNVMIRTAGDPTLVAPLLRSEVAALDPDLPIANVQSMENRLGIAFLPARLAATVLGVFGLLGLVLASLGVYGVMSYSVAQRHREIGIRLAIGAATGVVIRQLMRDGMSLVGIGIGIGLAGALAGARMLSGMLYGSSVDLVTFIAVPIVLGTVAALAILLPARRAAAVNPVVVLRQD